MGTRTTEKHYKYDICGKKHNQLSSLTMHRETHIILDAECHEIYVKSNTSIQLQMSCQETEQDDTITQPQMSCQETEPDYIITQPQF